MPEVIVFRDGSMRGEARRFTAGVRDMRNSGFNDRLTSYVVQPRGYGSQGRGYDNGAYGSGVYGNGGYGNDGYGNGGYGSGNGAVYDTGRYRRDDPGRYGGGGRRWTYQQAAVMVQQAYRRVLRREPDRDAQPWVDEVLKNSWSQRELEQALRNTPEARGR